MLKNSNLRSFHVFLFYEEKYLVIESYLRCENLLPAYIVESSLLETGEINLRYIWFM